MELKDITDAAIALGISTAQATAPASVLQATASHLRALIDSGADETHPRVVALLQLAITAQELTTANPQAGKPNQSTPRALRTSVDATVTEIASALGVRDSAAATDASTATSQGKTASAKQGTSGPHTEETRSDGNLGEKPKLRLAPRNAKVVAERVLALLAADQALGVRVQRENAVASLRGPRGGFPAPSRTPRDLAFQEAMEKRSALLPSTQASLQMVAPSEPWNFSVPDTSIATAPSPMQYGNGAPVRSHDMQAGATSHDIARTIPVQFPSAPGSNGATGFVPRHPLDTPSNAAAAAAQIALQAHGTVGPGQYASHGAPNQYFVTPASQHAMQYSGAPGFDAKPQYTSTNPTQLKKDHVTAAAAVAAAMTAAKSHLVVSGTEHQSGVTDQFTSGHEALVRANALGAGTSNAPAPGSISGTPTWSRVQAPTVPSPATLGLTPPEESEAAQLAQIPGNPSAYPVFQAEYAALESYEEHFVVLDQQYPFPVETQTPQYNIRAVLAAREREIYRMVQVRHAEIISLPEDVSEGIRRRAVIEGKQLKLMELQRRMRVQFAADFHANLAAPRDTRELPAVVDPAVSNYRREHPPVYSYTDGYPRVSTLDGHVGAIPERTPVALAAESARMAQFDQSRMAKQKADKHRNFLVRLMGHYQAFMGHHAQIWNHRSRIQKTFERYLADKKRAEEKRKKQEQMERLRLLRSNDEEAYMKLLRDTKNARLLQLVAQTDNYLMQIGAKVERSRGADDAAGEETSMTDDTTGDSVESMMRRRDMYYTVTHAISEDVKQPTIMVNGTLKQYQLEGLKWMISLYNNNLNGILADEMGLGKTIQTVSLITYLIEFKKNPGPFLVIVPLSTLGNWVRELDKWAPSVSKVVYRGDANTRRELYRSRILPMNFNVLLTTYEFTVKEHNILANIHWKYIIIDEGHRLKNANSKLAVMLSERYRSKNRLLLTGTPLQNNLTELWALLNFLLPSIFSSSQTFEEWFQQPFEQTTLGDGADLAEEETLLIINRLHQVLRPFLLRRLKTDVEAQLPDKVESVIRCDMSVWQRVLYRQMQNRIAVATGEDTGSSKTYNNLWMQLKKICNHPFLFYEQDQIDRLPDKALIRASGKFFLLHHVLMKLRSAGHRTLIFSQMTAALDYLEDFLALIGIQYMRLDGMTKADDRQGMLNDFNAKDSPYFCFLLSTRAGGLGLNLQTADTVIIFDSDWNPMMDLQAQDRAHRIGQTSEVRVIRLISSGTVEVRILDRANKKLAIDAQVIQAGQFNNKSTDNDRQNMLKTILRQANESNDGLGDDCPDLEEINRTIARSDEEFEKYQKYDEERAAEGAESLMTEESDLPGWVLKPEVEHKTAEEKLKEELATLGRGHRRRSTITDMDQLTEREWIKVMEGEITAEEAFARRKTRSRRQRQDATDGSGDDSSGGPDTEPAADGSEPDSPQTRPRRASRSGGKTPASKEGARSTTRTRTPAADAKTAPDGDKSSDEGTAPRSLRKRTRRPPAKADDEDEPEPSARKRRRSAAQESPKAESPKRAREDAEEEADEETAANESAPSTNGHVEDSESPAPSVRTSSRRKKPRLSKAADENDSSKVEADEGRGTPAKRGVSTRRSRKSTLGDKKAEAVLENGVNAHASSNGDGRRSSRGAGGASAEGPGESNGTPTRGGSRLRIRLRSPK